LPPVADLEKEPGAPDSLILGNKTKIAQGAKTARASKKKKRPGSPLLGPPLSTKFFYD